MRANSSDGTVAVKLPPRRRANPWIRRGLIFATCIVLLDALVGDRGVAQTIRARENLQRMSAGLQQLRRENAELRERVHDLQTDSATIEAVAREQLGLIRRGEVLIILKDSKPNPDSK
jgi:cell division protein FtsB